MKHKPQGRSPASLLVRCMALEKKGYWVAMCLDLDLVVQADTVARARKLLKEQIASYLADAVTIDHEQSVVLLTRRAPLRYYLMYYLAKLVHSTKHRLSYESAMPLVPLAA